MTKSNLSVIVISTLITVFVGASGAQAADAKTLSGSSCTSTGSGFMIDSYGNALNTSTKDLVMTCPVVRDITGGRVSFMKVYVQDRHPSRNARCILASRLPTSKTARRYPVRGWEYTSGYGTHSRVLHLGGFGRSWVAGGNYVQCVIPARYGSAYSGITTLNYGEET